MQQYWLAGVLLLVPAIAQADPVEDLQLWTSIIASGSIAGDLVGQVEASARLGDDLKRVRQTLTRGSIGYKITPDLTLSLGFGHITGYRAGLRDNVEERIYQQANWRIASLGRGALSTRVRLEQRFVRPGRDVGWRYRQTLRYQVPLARGKNSLIVQAEPFIAINSTDWGGRAGFDQVRGLIGVAVPLSKWMTLEAGYQAQYVRSVGADRLNHIVPVTLTFAF